MPNGQLQRAADFRAPFRAFSGLFPVLRDGAIGGKDAGLTDWSDCIVAIATSRDRQRFALLFAHFAPRCKSFFMRLGASPGVAEDLAQETLLSVWRKANRFDPARAQASTWIYTIARNLRIDMQRRERDPSRLAEFFEGVSEPSPSDHVLSAEREERVHVALGELPKEQADVIRLSFFEDRPHAEIAGLLGIPLGTVKSRVRLAMNRLRALVEDRQ
jgi:RNA polymerase sigma-70 factor (ECF subfamily)